MENRIAFFPYDKFMLPILRHIGLLGSNHCAQLAISRKGNGIVGRDAALICSHPPIGVPVIDQMNAGFKWDTLFVSCSSIKNEHTSFDYINFFRSCLDAQKHICFADSSMLELPSNLKVLSEAYPRQTKFISAAHSNYYSMLEDSIKYMPLPVPVLLVGGLVRGSDSLEIILSLQEHFSYGGHIVSCFVDNDLGLPFGMHTFRHIFADTTISEAEKIRRINQLARSVIRIECPELIIVEAPDEVLRLNTVVPNDFSIRTHMIIQALDVNAFICCIPVDLATQSFIAAISRGFMDHYEFPIVAIQVSNVLIDGANVFRDQEISYVHTDMELVSKSVKEVSQNCPTPVYDVISQGAYELYQHIIQVL